MKLVHWFSFATLIVALVLFFVGQSTAAAGVLLAIASAGELLHSALTGKQTNEGTR